MASLLTTEELTYLDDLYFATHQGEAELRVYNCGRQLDNVGQLAGVPGSAWVAKDRVTAVIVRDVKREVLETFDEPERLSALYRARHGQAGKVLAGDVIAEADGTVWLVFEPSEYANGRPRVRAGLELVPGTMVPATLRAGRRPPSGEDELKHTNYATITASDDPAINLRVTLAVSGADLVPTGAKVVGFSSRGNLDPMLISVNGAGNLISFDFPEGTDPLDPALDWVAFAY